MGEVEEDGKFIDINKYHSGYNYTDEFGEDHQFVFTSEFYEVKGRYFRKGYLDSVFRVFEYNKLDDGSYEFKD